ncbi:hypothetical protein C8J57DRAFT_1479457 [Mycena rebaudengoi]|nr:hypothetical protein C8J57DRAFT_1479457 [Mycena rebaudengoi]
MIRHSTITQDTKSAIAFQRRYATLTNPPWPCAHAVARPPWRGLRVKLPGFTSLRACAGLALTLGIVLVPQRGCWLRRHKRGLRNGLPAVEGIPMVLSPCAGAGGTTIAWRGSVQEGGGASSAHASAGVGIERKWRVNGKWAPAASDGSGGRKRAKRVVCYGG